MTTMPCCDTAIGRQIWRYELRDLDPAERERFEEHLMVCASCRNEVVKMLPVIGALRPNRADLLATFEANGITYDRLRDEVPRKENRTAKQDTTFTLWPSRLTDWLARWRRPWLLAPSLVAVAAVAVMAVFWSPRQSAYLGLLRFEPLLYERNAARGNEVLQQSDPFVKGMDAYCTGDYGKAVSWLSNVVARNPVNTTAWLYLGVSYYLQKEPRPAIKALRRVQSTSDPALRDAAQWYLSQAFLLNNQEDSALVRISGLERISRWRPDADSLTVKLRAWKGTP